MLLERIASMSHWQIDLVAFVLLLQGAIVSLAPEEVIIVTLGLFWGRGRLGFPEALVSVLLGLLPANSMMVFFGEKLTRRFSEKTFVKVAAHYIEKYGDWVVFMTRFTPIVRGPIYLSLGASKFRVGRFFRVDSLAACIQVPLLLLIGRTIGSRADSVNAALRMIGWMGGGLLGLTVVFTVLLERRERLNQTQN